MEETSTKPYMLRALYEWCVDNGYTPHLAVKVDSHTQVPQEFARNGEITLNISPSAVHKLQMGNDLIEFSARFGGVARQICVPVQNVFALYARETGHGMTFDTEAPKQAVKVKPQAEPDPKSPQVLPLPAPAGGSEPPKNTPPGGKPTLRRVK